MVEREPASEREHRHLTERWDCLQQWLVSRLQPNGPQMRAVEGLARRDDPPELALFLAECLDHTDPAHVLVDDLGDVAFLLLTVPGRREHLGAHPVGDDEHCRRHDHAHEREERREHQHDGK